MTRHCSKLGDRRFPLFSSPAVPVAVRSRMVLNDRARGRSTRRRDRGQDSWSFTSQRLSILLCFSSWRAFDPLKRADAPACGCCRSTRAYLVPAGRARNPRVSEHLLVLFVTNTNWQTTAGEEHDVLPRARCSGLAHQRISSRRRRPIVAPAVAPHSGFSRPSALDDDGVVNFLGRCHPPARLPTSCLPGRIVYGAAPVLIGGGHGPYAADPRAPLRSEGHHSGRAPQATPIRGRPVASQSLRIQVLPAQPRWVASSMPCGASFPKKIPNALSTSVHNDPIYISPTPFPAGRGLNQLCSCGCRTSAWFGRCSPRWGWPLSFSPGPSPSPIGREASGTATLTHSKEPRLTNMEGKEVALFFRTRSPPPFVVLPWFTDGCLLAGAVTPCRNPLFPRSRGMTQPDPTMQLGDIIGRRCHCRPSRPPCPACFRRSLTVFIGPG